MEILELTALELGNCIRKGEIAVEEALDAVLSRIADREKELHCYITVSEKQAKEQAEILQRKIKNKELTGPLAGVPFAVKDNICTKGMMTTCGSKILNGFAPDYDAECVRRLRAAGALLIGKTNLDEFGMGSTTETSYFGPTVNPFRDGYCAGGSSGGSAAAVAAGECFCALGTDTGGSVRLPASHCGVVGMKPAYGAVSRYGIAAYGSSLEQAGPLAKDVRDCAAMLTVISGKDYRDSTSGAGEKVDFLEGLTGEIDGLRIGIPKAWFADGLQEDVRSTVLAAAESLRRMGASVEEFELKHTEYVVPAYYTIASAEASSNLERYDGVKYGFRAPGENLNAMYRRTRSEGFGAEVKRRILLGTFVLSEGYYDAYYLRALKVRRLICDAFSEAFSSYDLILGPVAPSPAPRLGESLKEPLKMYMSDLYTVPANLAGLPAISLPASCSGDGLPIGVQLIGRLGGEKRLLNAAYALEQSRKSERKSEQI